MYWMLKAHATSLYEKHKVRVKWQKYVYTLAFNRSKRHYGSSFRSRASVTTALTQIYVCMCMILTNLQKYIDICT